MIDLSGSGQSGTGRLRDFRWNHFDQLVIFLSQQIEGHEGRFARPDIVESSYSGIRRLEKRVTCLQGLLRLPLYLKRDFSLNDMSHDRAGMDVQSCFLSHREFDFLNFHSVHDLGALYGRGKQRLSRDGIHALSRLHVVRSQDRAYRKSDDCQERVIAHLYDT